MNADFQLDTSKFDEVIEKSRQLADKMGSLRHEMDTMENKLMQSWAGVGGNMFEKKYRLFTQQFSDLKDELYEISEGLLEIQEQYIQWDTDLAKAADGITNRY